MSLSKISFIDLVKKQYLFKLRAYSGIFTTLIVLQLLGIFFSVIGGNSSGTLSTNLDVTATYYSADQVIIFTMIWLFISAILITTKAYREDDFTFVTNRQSNHLANTLILITASFIGGITSYLSGFLIKLATRFFDHHYLAISGLPSTWLELISGVIALILMLIFLGALGYLIGTIIQLHKVFIVIVPVLLIGLLMLVTSIGDGRLGSQIFGFYFADPSIILFSVKTLSTSILLFISSIVISNRQEVRL